MICVFDRDSKGNLQRAPFRPARVRGPRQVRRHDVPRPTDLVDASAVILLLVESGRCEAGEFPLSPSQIGNAHCGKLNTAKFFWRKRDRNANDAVEDPVIAENAPEGAAFSQ